MDSERPTKEEALQFATLMARAGMPSEDAIQYFFPDAHTDEELLMVRKEHDRWVRSKAFKAALRQANGWAWEDLPLDQQIQNAVNKNYKELAYFLYRNNYVGASNADKQTANLARQALEAKLAGTAGKTDGVSAFFDDVRSGRIKLQTLPTAALAPLKAN